MADSINTVVDKVAYEQLDKLQTHIKDCRLEMVEFLKVTGKGSTVKVKVPSDVDQELARISTEQKKFNELVEKQNQLLLKAAEVKKKATSATNTQSAALSLEEKIQRKAAQAVEARQISEHKLNKEIQKNLAQASANNKSLRDTQSETEKVAAATQKHSSQIKWKSDELKKLAQANARVIESESKVGQEIQRTRNQATQNNRVIRMTETFYGKVSLKLQKTAREYKELSLRKQLMNNLTEKEIQRMALLEGRLDKYYEALSKADQRTGNFSRNVGNYASGFNGLGFSIAQLSREMPAFANSMQTGFMALSNNIPMLVDEINNLKAANADLIAQGKPTKSVFSSLTAAIFSWQTAISIGVTVLTVYGEEIIKAISNLFDFRSAAEKSEDGIKDLNKTLETYSENLDDLSRAQLEGAQNAQKELMALRLLNEEVQDVNSSEEERRKALKRLRDLYPQHLKNLSDEEIMLNGLGDSYGDLVDEILETARSMAAFDKIVENQKKQLEITGLIVEKEQELAAVRQKAADAEERAITAISKNAPGAEALRSRAGDLRDTANELEIQVLSLKNEQDRLESSNKSLADSIETVSDVTEQSGEETAKTTQKEREKVKALERTKEVVRGSIEWIDHLISTYESFKKENVLTAEQLRVVNKELEKLKDFRDIQLGNFDISELLQFDDAEIQAGMEQLQVYLDGKIPQAAKNLAGVLGASTQDLMEEFLSLYEWDYQNWLKFQEKKLDAFRDTNEVLTEEQIQGIQNLAQEMQLMASAIADIFGGLSERRIQQMEAEMAANDKMWEKALENEQLSERQRKLYKKAREKDREAFEKKKQKEMEKQAKIQKAQAIASIIINTAVAISKVLGQTGLFGLPLVPLVAATGAMQLAAVIAQPIPKYKHGRKRGPAELAEVGDGGKEEVILDKHGNLKAITPNKPTLTYLEKDDQVLPSKDHYDAILRASIMASFAGEKIPTEDLGTILDRHLVNAREEMKKGVKEGMREWKFPKQKSQDMEKTLKTMLKANV